MNSTEIVALVGCCACVASHDNGASTSSSRSRVPDATPVVVGEPLLDDGVSNSAGGNANCSPPVLVRDFRISAISRMKGDYMRVPSAGKRVCVPQSNTLVMIEFECSSRVPREMREVENDTLAKGGHRVAGIGKQTVQLGPRSITWDDDSDCKFVAEATPPLDPVDYAREMVREFP